MTNNLDICEEDAVYIPTFECPECAAASEIKYARTYSHSVAIPYGESDAISVAQIDFKTPGIYRLDFTYLFGVDTIEGADTSPIGLFHVGMMNNADYDAVNPVFDPYSGHLVSSFSIIPYTGSAEVTQSWILTPGADSDLVQELVVFCERLRNGQISANATASLFITVTRLGDLNELVLGTDIAIYPTVVER